MKEYFSQDWLVELRDFLNSTTFRNIGKTLSTEKGIIYPKTLEEAFRVFKVTSLKSIKVCILGVEPYIDGRGDGLAFSDGNSLSTAPILRNILKEVENDCYHGFTLNTDTNLLRWAEQGVFLFNTALTVKKNKSGSHSELWKPFTIEVMRILSIKIPECVYLLWGSKAQSFSQYITSPGSLIISSTTDFNGSKPFSKCNEQLNALNKREIIW